MDVACGTGRFLTFVRDNHPTAHVTGVELSPNNVARATSDMAYFERFHSEARRNPPLTGSANFLWGRAEDLPAGEASHDVITTLQLFHELPPGVREKVVGEMYRALKPGGLAVCLDAFQGVGPISAEKEVVMRGFADSLYEPYYDSYIVLDMVGLFEEAGFVKVAQSHVHAQTCWTVRKP